jgi:hypothetical protein
MGNVDDWLTLTNDDLAPTSGESNDFVILITFVNQRYHVIVG